MALLYLCIILARGVSGPAISIVARGPVYSVAFAGLVLLACSLRSEKVMGLLKGPAYLGIISYGIYLWHLPIILLIKPYGLDPFTVLILTLAITISVASLSWHFFEAPIMSWAARSSGVVSRPMEASFAVLPHMQSRQRPPISRIVTSMLCSLRSRD